MEQTKGPGSLIDTSGVGADEASEARYLTAMTLAKVSVLLHHRLLA
jgi:hypothetical protein